MVKIQCTKSEVTFLIAFSAISQMLLYTADATSGAENAWLFRRTWAHPTVFSGVRVARSLVFCVVFFCRSLFVFLSFFFRSLCCLSLFDSRILITSLWYLQALLINIWRRYGTDIIVLLTIKHPIVLDGPGSALNRLCWSNKLCMSLIGWIFCKKLSLWFIDNHHPERIVVMLFT